MPRLPWAAALPLQQPSPTTELGNGSTQGRHPSTAPSVVLRVRVSPSPIALPHLLPRAPEDGGVKLPTPLSSCLLHGEICALARKGAQLQQGGRAGQGRAAASGKFLITAEMKLVRTTALHFQMRAALLLHIPGVPLATQLHGAAEKLQRRQAPAPPDWARSSRPGRHRCHTRHQRPGHLSSPKKTL